MQDENNGVTEYAFSRKYDAEHAHKYYEKHASGFWRKISSWREVGMARKALALAGHPRSVLDMPCGTGRFWKMLAEESGRQIFAADSSRPMIETGLALRAPEVRARIKKTFQCSAFETGLPDNFVECVFCIRLLHHITKSEDRVKMLKEFARVGSESVVVSLWVDGNFKAYRLKRKLERRALLEGRPADRDRGLVSRAQIESEIVAAGLEVVGYVDFIKYWDKWRTYVLRVKRA